MLYIVGGPSRSGKSIIADRFLKSSQVPYISLDLLMMGLYKGLADFGVDPEAHPAAVAAKIWPVVRSVSVTILEDGLEYLAVFPLIFANRGGNTIRLVIDTDPGVDDAHAIMAAFPHPEAQVEAITTVTGNVSLERDVVRKAETHYVQVGYYGP